MSEKKSTIRERIAAVLAESCAVRGGDAAMDADVSLMKIQDILAEMSDETATGRERVNPTHALRLSVIGHARGSADASSYEAADRCLLWMNTMMWFLQRISPMRLESDETDSEEIVAMLSFYSELAFLLSEEAGLHMAAVETERSRLESFYAAKGGKV